MDAVSDNPPNHESNMQVCLSGREAGHAHEGHAGEAGRRQHLQAD